MAGDEEDGRMYVLLLFITVFMRLAFIRRRSRFQPRLRLLTIRSNEENRCVLFSYGGNFVKGKSLGFLKGQSSGSSIWF